MNGKVFAAVIAALVILIVVVVVVVVVVLKKKKTSDPESQSNSSDTSDLTPPAPAESTAEVLKVQFFQHCDYGGTMWELGPGSYTTGFDDNQISSVKIPPGYKVSMYENADKSGGQQIQSHNPKPPADVTKWMEIPCLIQTGQMAVYNLNDKISAIDIERLI
jgi:hypothetical protein